ncbi:MAG: hypothetical protein BA871_14270 [Desulfuromonadales bacterium C00003096]|jgi:hypothetical protein|nr:MAG: hypothetical protein BA871_14270 [Desulfuromonadales bacterium C00003096]
MRSANSFGAQIKNSEIAGWVGAKTADTGDAAGRASIAILPALHPLRLGYAACRGGLFFQEALRTRRFLRVMELIFDSSKRVALSFSFAKKTLGLSQVGFRVALTVSCCYFQP